MVYKYGLRLRGVSIGTQPQGFIAYEDSNKSETGYWSFVFYDRKLTEDEIQKYDMVFIDENIWIEKLK